MKLVVLSPENDLPQEAEIVSAFFDAGLERYHLRKPTWGRVDNEKWLSARPIEERNRFVLHDHHDLVATLGLGGRHWRDDTKAPLDPPRGNGLTSRSCHTLSVLESALGYYDSVFFSPVFSSISKPGYGPAEATIERLRTLLACRTRVQRTTQVLALGGVTVERLIACRELGFDGVGVLGTVWRTENPVQAVEELQSALLLYAA
jgi:thiamine-phosphate pyrophosphorylase